MKPLLTLSPTHGFYSHRILPRRYVLFLVVGVLAAFSIGLFATSRTNASNTEIGSGNGNAIQLNPARSRLANFAFLFPFARYTAPTPTVGTCDIGNNIEVEATGGANAGYATLKAAFDAINAGTHTGTITIDICGNTTEAAVGGAPSVTLNASGSGAASYTTITISPAGGAARTISGAATAGQALISLSGADNVIIDGLNAGGNSLTISNTTASATLGTSTILFAGGATNNTITNSTISGSFSGNVAANGGTIFFSTDAVTANGNDNNSISNNNIGPAGANLPTKAIFGIGSTTTTAIGNSGIVIDNNNIFDYFSATVTSSGIATNGGCNTWTITNNRFYQTATRTWTTGAIHRAIDIGNSTATSGAQGFTITGNIIGYASNTQSGTYTLTGSTGKFQGIVFSGITGATVSNINGNTIASVSMTGVTSSGATTSSPFAGIIVSNGLANTNSNTIGSQNVTGSLTFSTNTNTTTDTYGILAQGSDNWTANSNSIGGISVTNAGTATMLLFGMRASAGTATSVTATSNLVGGTIASSIQLSATGTSSQTIGLATSNPAATFTSNTVRNLISNIGTGTGASASVIGIQLNAASTNHTVSQNTIFNLTNTNASAAVAVTGINYNSSNGTNLIARNFIHSLATPSTSATAQLNGINVTGGTATYRNNMVRLGIDGAGSSLTNGIIINGINETTAGTDNFYFNSVFVGGVGVGGSANTFAFQSSITTNTRNYIDNVFVNARSNGAGTGKHYGIRVGGTAPNPAGLTINYNVYNVTGTGGVFGLFNAIDRADITAWRTAVGQDANSQSADPLFINPTGTSTTVDLHIQSGFATPVEGLGVDIGTVTDDFDGEMRSSLTPVDIGADAGAFVTADVSAPLISYTPLGNTSSLSNRSFTATIVDATGVPTTGSFVPRIYFKKNSDPYVSEPGSLTTGNGQNGTWTFTIVVADMGGVAGGDTISYFVIAQDRVGNIASNPSGAVATDVNTVTSPPPTPNSYTIPQISGTFNVGSGGDYATLTAAIAAYNNAVINGAVTFRLTDATYPSETFPITINANNGSSSTNTLTIVPASGVSPTISGNSGNADTSILKLNGADYVIIDGSNNGSSSRDLTISNTSLFPSTAVVWLSSMGTGAGATNNVVKNCNLAAGADQTANTTVTFGILSSGTSANNINDGVDNDNNTFTNNSITKARYGIFLRGTAANTNDGNIISSNVIGPTGFGVNEIGTNGIVIQNQNLATVAQNEVRFVGGTLSTRNSGSSSFKSIGIGIGSETWTPANSIITNSSIVRNLIHDIVDERTGSAIGIVVAGTGTPSGNIVANNMLYNIRANATSSSNQTVGIGIGYGSGDKVVFNTISLTGDLDPSGATATSQSAAGIRIVSTTPTNLTLKNNIISADVNSNPPATLRHFAIIAPSTSYAWGTGGANNNDYYVNPANTQMVLGGIGTTVPYTQVGTLALWRTQFNPNQDSASQTVNPPFISATDLHLSTSTATTLESGGISVTGVTDDFDGDTRGSVPDIGADEGAFVAGFANDIAAAAFIDPLNGGTKQATVAFAPQASFANVGTAGQINVPVRYKIVGPSPSTTEVYNQTTTIASLPFGTTVTATFPNATIASGGTYTITATAELIGDGNAVNDQISGSLTVVVPMTGSHNVGTGQEYATLTAAIADLNARGVAGPVTLVLTSSYTSSGESFPITFSTVTGASSTSTITIKPDSGVTPTISGSSSCVVKLNGADFIVFDGSNTIGGTTRDLTITNTNNAANTAAVCLSSLGVSAGATNNTIKNTNISTGVDQTANSGNPSFAIFGGGVAVSTTSDGQDNDNNSFTNNFINKARYGIYLRGKALNLNDNNTISGNLIGPTAFGSTEIGVAGVVLQYQNAASVTQNEVRFVGSLVAQNPFDNSRAGIAVGGVGDSPWQPGNPTSVTNSSITRNLIHDIVDEREFSAVGIILAGASFPSNNLVANNMLYGIRSNGTAGDQALGIGISAGDGDKVVFNSVSLTGDMDPSGTVATTGSAAALRINSSAVTDLTLKDNIFSVDVSSNTGALKHYTIEAPSSSYSWGTGGANNNDFYFNASNTQMALGGLGEPPIDATFTTVSTLADWKTTFTPNQDGSSISADPLFVSATNLHVSSGSPVSGAGTPVSGVTVDFDGDNRDATTPDIGADEIAVNFSSSGNGNLAAGTYDNITINSPDTITLTGNITGNTAIIVKNGATLNCGTFIISGLATFTIEAGGNLGVGDANGISSSGASGNIQVSGARTYTAGSNYNFNGTAPQITGNGLPASVNNLTISNSAGVNLSQNVNVDGLLALSLGDLATGSFVLTENGSSDSASTGDVIGNVARTDLTTTPKQFGNPNNQITINFGAITALTMNLDKGATPADFPQSVRRNYTLTPDAGSLTQATVKLHYLDSELNGNTEDSTLHLWRKDGSTWTDVGQSDANTTDNWVEYNNVTGFSPWTISGPSAPTAVKLSKFEAESFADGVELNWESGFEVDNLGYHVYRERNGQRERVTPAVIAGSALKVGPRSQLRAGYAYSWFDTEGTPQTAYYLEAIDLNGTRELIGPIYPVRGNGESRHAARDRARLLGEPIFSDALDASDPSRFEQTWPASMADDGSAGSKSAMKESVSPLTAPSVSESSLPGGAAVKISVARAGWYRVTQPELVAAGLDANSDPRRLQLFVGGEEVPIIVNANGGRLQAGDSIEFYGQALDTLSTTTQVYWLINGTSNGKRITRPKAPKPSNQDWTNLVGGSFGMTVARADKLIYFSSLLNSDATNIFGPVITTSPTTQNLTINNLDASSTEAQLSVSLQGATDVAHEVQVQLNGASVGTVSFTGRQHPTQSFSLSRSLLHDGANEVKLSATGGATDVSLVDSVSLTYAHSYRADSNALRFSVVAGQTVIVDGFTSSAIRVIDITNPALPSEVAPQINAMNGGYAFKLQTSGSGTRTFMAFTGDFASHPSALAANQPSSLTTMTATDMLIVTHKNFRSAVEPLAAQRRTEGLTVSVVDIEDIYDEFSFGVHTPNALRDFLAWTNTHWTHAPRYLLLVGDSSWDPKDSLGQGFADFVPTKLIDTVYLETASDDWLSDFDGDGIADIATGRLPVRTAAEATLMVNKILGYEQERQSGTPARGALMVADSGFESESSATAALLPSNIAVTTINRADVGSDDLTRTQIVNNLNNGPLVANYFGHGSVTVWTGAGLLDSDLATNLTNQNRPTLFVLMTCLNGYSHDAYIDSLGESLLKAPNGGAMAVWASSGFTESGPQFVMSSQFYQQLFSSTSVRLGDGFKPAKLTISDKDVQRTWLLLGDPSMRLR